MSKPIAFFIVVRRRNLFNKYFCWMLPKTVNVQCVHRKGGETPFTAKIGSVYTLDSRDVRLDVKQFQSIYRLVKFANWGQVKAYCKAQGVDMSNIKK